jgi:hypothetical protein
MGIKNKPRMCASKRRNRGNAQQRGLEENVQADDSLGMPDDALVK